ncbi:uncharacterized protein ACA1_282480 [Acanthamoeba castellanii str. Neff]|uniref:PH domain-containing protein n=1 Tax=Acanthamoeba castellanii (strain ATCC 30010 / Neff) TaxID=1257118 RepID=L8H8P7_ACACF|nr:uncharacterized protein ACA1_282480 [Acanthamoeba castellanii str. Neff]ELR21083.1 hypothetical protein ACA1_282480 [Acanthamoeba castellanii str. Neff]
MENVVATAPLPLYGYLQKKGEKGLVRSYKKRWFEQNGSKIFYFHERGEKNALGFIDCIEISTVRRTDENGLASPGGRPSVRRDASVPFEIITPKRIYEFIASTEKDCNYWVNGLNQYLQYQEAMLDTQGMMAAHDQQVTSLQEKLEDIKKRHTLQSIQWAERDKELEKELAALQERLKKQEADAQAKQSELDQKTAESLERLRELNRAKKDLESEKKQREESENEAKKNEEASRLALSRAEERLLDKVAEREREIDELRSRLAKKDADMLDYVKSQQTTSTSTDERDHLREMFESEIEERRRETERTKAQYEEKLAELAQAKDDEARRQVDELERAHSAALRRVADEAERKAEASEEAWQLRAKEFEARTDELRRRVADKKSKIKQRNGWLRELEAQAKQGANDEAAQRAQKLDIEGRDVERQLRDREQELQDRERELGEVRAKLAVATKQKKALKTEVQGKLNEMEKVLLKKSQEMHSMRDALQDQKKRKEEEEAGAELARLGEEVRQSAAALEAKDERVRQLERVNEELEARVKTLQAGLDEREREVEALKREKEELQVPKGESKSAKKLREELEAALSRAKAKAQSKDDMLRALSQKLVEIEADLEQRLRAKDEAIEQLHIRLADSTEQKNALADRFEELLKSSQHGSRDEAERKRKQEDEVNELKLALRLKDEEIHMLTDLGGGSGGRGKGKVPGHHSDGEVENAILHEKMEELRQELFYSLAVGIKLNLSMQGIQCTQSITTLYDDAMRDMIPTSAWNSWIFNRLSRV